MSDKHKPKFKVEGNGVVKVKSSDLLESKKVKKCLEGVSKIRRK